MVTQSAISHDDGLVADRKPTPIIRDADQLLRRGIEALEHDRFEEAARLLQQAVDLAPDSPMASLALGITLCRLLRIPEATAALENAIALDPQAFYPHFRMAELYMRVGLVAQAEEELSSRDGSEHQRLRAPPGSGAARDRPQARAAAYLAP